VKKFTLETKLKESTKQLYPNHHGQILIDKPAINKPPNPYYNMDRDQFITALKTGEGTPRGDLPPIIGNGANQIKLNDMKKVHKLIVNNSTGEFVITKEMW